MRRAWGCCARCALTLGGARARDSKAAAAMQELDVPVVQGRGAARSARELAAEGAAGRTEPFSQTFQGGGDAAAANASHANASRAGQGSRARKVPFSEVSYIDMFLRREGWDSVAGAVPYRLHPLPSNPLPPQRVAGAETPPSLHAGRRGLGHGAGGVDGTNAGARGPEPGEADDVTRLGRCDRGRLPPVASPPGASHLTPASSE